MILRALATLLLLAVPASADDLRGTGDLGLIVEREAGSLLVVDRSERAAIGRIEGLGDLSHASLVYAPDERFAFVFGRDGGLTKVDILTRQIVKRVEQAGNSIGGAISDDGRLIAVANYEPGGVRVFDSETLEMVADIPMGSKTVGIADIPGMRFAVATWDTGEVWILDHSQDPSNPEITTLTDIGANPYDALLTGDGRTYIVGLFGEKGLTAIDMWQDPPEATRFLPDYGKDQPDLPVYKMPHLQGWTLADGVFALPAVGLHQLLWVDADSLTEIGRTELAGQPVFALARPDKREVWVNFAPPDNDSIQIVDVLSHEVVETLQPGKGVLHMEFSPRGDEVWLSVRDENRIEIRDTRSREVLAEIAADAPSGIFFTDRAHRTGL